MTSKAALVQALFPSVSLLLVLAAYWVLFRVYAWSATLPAGVMLRFFAVGAVGSVVLALYLQALPIPFTLDPNGTMYATVDPRIWMLGPLAEEFAKALPVILIAFVFPYGRRLSIADFALIGFTTGLGFEFVEANFGAVIHGDVASLANVFGLGYSVDSRGAWDSTYYFAGHWTYPALVGAGAGIGLRFLPRAWRAGWVPALALFALGTFDHSMWNFKEAHAYPNSFNPAAPLAETLYNATGHGFYAIVLLPVLVILASLLEAGWFAKARPSAATARLPGENGIPYIGELLAVASRLKLGWAASTRAFRYMAHRRSAAIAAAEAARTPSDSVATGHAQVCTERLARERDVVAGAEPAPWIPPPEIFIPALASFARRSAFALVALALAVLAFMLPPASVPFVHTRVSALLISLFAASLAVWGFIALRRARFDPVRADVEKLASRRVRAMLVSSSAVTASIPLLALIVDRRLLIPGAVAYVSTYFGGWMAGGGDPSTLFGTGGAVAGAPGEPVPPDDPPSPSGPLPPAEPPDEEPKPSTCKDEQETVNDDRSRYEASYWVVRVRLANLRKFVEFYYDHVDRSQADRDRGRDRDLAEARDEEKEAEVQARWADLEEEKAREWGRLADEADANAKRTTDPADKAMFEKEAWDYGQRSIACSNEVNAARDKARQLRWHAQWLLGSGSREALEQTKDSVFNLYVEGVRAYEADAEKLKKHYAALLACWQQNNIAPDPEIDLPIFQTFSTESRDFFL